MRHVIDFLTAEEYTPKQSIVAAIVVVAIIAIFG